jgi:sugar phosphate isomerase/epimerase
MTGGAIVSLAAAPTARAWGATGAEPARSKSRIPFHLGLASYTLRNFSLDRALAMTRRVGLERICLKSVHLPLDAKPAEIATVAGKVKQAGLILYAGGVISMKSERDVVQAFDYAKVAGLPMITAAPAPELLPVLDEHVKKYDIAVAIHNHGPGDRYFPTPKSVYDAVKALDRRIGLCIDIGHTVRIGADLSGSIRSCGDRVFDLHVKDVTAATQEGHGTPVGRGIIDFPGLVRDLIEVKFKGVAAFEYEEQPDDPLPGLSESVGYLKGVLAVI